ncbi:MAG: MATE family efflux transporter [Alphaproteobacteria bacterium]|nr:MATE family efflux transporter [Alphaproteobacteria bacterium]
MTTHVAPTNWHRRVWALAGPIILSNLSQPLLGMVDTAVMGHLDAPAYIGAVAVSSVIFSYIYWSFGFLRMGTTGFTAQAAGAGNADELRATLGRSLLLAGAIGAAVLAAQRPVLVGALGLIDASPAVKHLAGAYFSIRIWGAPAALANYVVIGWLLGRQRAGITLALQLALNGVNAALALLFVVGFGWGVEGVAAATVVAELITAAAGLTIVAAHLRRIGGRWQRRRLLDAARLRRMLAVNRDIFLRTLCLVTTFALFTSRGAAQGDAVLAANAVLMQFLMLVSYGLDGFAHATEALVGNAIGAGDRTALRQAVRTATLWSATVAAGFAAVYGAGGWLLIDALTSLTAVREAARAFLPWLVALPLVAIWAYQFDGVFLGAIRPRPMRNGMILALLLFVLIAWQGEPRWGNHALWLGLTAFLATRALVLLASYPRLVREAIRDPVSSASRPGSRTA